jgi:hypothetical protein
MPTGIQHLLVRDKSRIREIFAKALGDNYQWPKAAPAEAGA